MIRLFAAAALATIAVFTCRNFVRQGRRPVTGDGGRQPLQTWEDEGGGVPASASQTLAQVPPADESGASLSVDKTE